MNGLEGQDGRWKVDFVVSVVPWSTSSKAYIWLKMTIIVKSNRESQKHVIEDDYYSEK
jgi:hypothetical protein